MKRSYAVQDRDHVIRPAASKGVARRDRAAYGGLLMSRKSEEADWKPYKGRHIFLWVFMAVQVIFIIWLVAGTSSTGGGINADVVAQCHGEAAGMGMTQAQCVSFLGGAAKAGTAIGAGLVVVLWVIVDFLLAVTYGIYRLARRNS